MNHEEDEIMMDTDTKKPSHETVIYTCNGAFSTTGLLAGLAAHEAVKQVGLKKAAVGCLAGLALELPVVRNKTDAAKRIVTVDGCPMECAKKTVEKAGYKVSTAISLVRDLKIEKVSLDKDLAGTPKPVMDYISRDDFDRATSAIVKAIMNKT